MSLLLQMVPMLLVRALLESLLLVWLVSELSVVLMLVLLLLLLLLLFGPFFEEGMRFFPPA